MDGWIDLCILCGTTTPDLPKKLDAPRKSQQKMPQTAGPRLHKISCRCPTHQSIMSSSRPHQKSSPRSSDSSTAEIPRIWWQHKSYELLTIRYVGIGHKLWTLSLYGSFDTNVYQSVPQKIDPQDPVPLTFPWTIYIPWINPHLCSWHKVSSIDFSPSDASQAQGTIPASKICQTSIWRRAVGEQLLEVIGMTGSIWEIVAKIMINRGESW